MLLMTAHFSRQKPRAPRDASPLLWPPSTGRNLDLDFHVFGIALCFQKGEKFRSTAAELTMITCVGHAGWVGMSENIKRYLN